MSAQWPSSVATDANLYVAVNSLQTTLATALGTGDASVVLASATGFPVAGGVTIDNEVIFYTGVSGATLTGCTRGADGTTAATHSIGVPVGAAVIAFHHNGLMAEIEAIELYLDTVLGKGTAVTATEFGYVHGVTSAIQTQMNLKAAIAGPTFTGTVTIPTPFTLGAVSVTSTGTELNYVAGVTSAVQTQLNTKATDSLVVHLAGTESVTGAKTFSSLVATLAGALVASGNKVTGLAAGSANGDSIRYEQVFPFRVLQVVEGSTTSVATSTSTSFADSNLSATITPASSSSTILVIVSQSCEASGGNGVTVCSLQLVRTSTVILGPNVACYQGAVTTNDLFNTHVMVKLDSPATTSAVTYKTQFARGAGTGTASVNDSFNSVASKSTITLIEIG